jgi:hypothetical protein
MESVNNNTSSTFSKDLQSEVYNNGANNSQVFRLFDTLDLLEIIIDTLEQTFIKVNQSNHTVAYLPQTQQKDSQAIQPLSHNLNESPELEDRVEILCEQIETFKSLLYYKELELQEVRQELHDTNKELSTVMNSPWRSFDEAKEIAKKLLVSKKPSHKILLELLGNIYNSTATLSELEQQEILNSTKPSITKPLTSVSVSYSFTTCETTSTQGAETRKKAIEIRAKSKTLRDQSIKVQAQLKESKAQFIEQGIKFIGSQASLTSHQTDSKDKRKQKIHRADFSQLDEFFALLCKKGVKRFTA